MSKTLGVCVNEALITIGDPEVTAFTSTNILQQTLIDEANDTVDEILEAARYRWGLHRDSFTTDAKITSGEANVTNGSTTVTSVTSAGVGAQNFTGAAAGDYFRVSSDNTSYEIASVDVSSDPHTVTLADNFLGTTVTSGTGYTILKDVYSISVTNLDEIVIATYGESQAGIGGDRLKIVHPRELINLSGGDLHRWTGGKPRYMAEFSVDSSDVPRILLWPFPDSQYLIDLWYTIKYSNTTFGTNMFGGDAPKVAYDAVSCRLKWRACIYDENYREADLWNQRYERARLQLLQRENRDHRDEQALTVESYRRSTIMLRRRGIEVRSQIEFDRIGGG